MGVYREYGYLVHLTYDFEPLPEAAYKDINAYAKKFATEHGSHLSEFQQSSFVEGVTQVSEAFKEHKHTLDGHLNDISNSVRETAADFHTGVKTAFEPARKVMRALSGIKYDHQFPALHEGEDPRTTPNVSLPFPSQFDTSTDILNIFYGFANGAIDVFPTESLPNFCRTNTTNTYWQVMRLFVDNQYDYAQEADLYKFTLGI